MFKELTETTYLRAAHMGLDAAMMRNKVIANNIANVNTPTYNRQFVTFEDRLKRVVDGDIDIQGKMSNSAHIPINPVGMQWAKPRTEVEEGTAMRNDENNVDIDREMADMAKNNLMYQFLIKRVAGHFSEISNVIQRGARG